MSLPVFQLSEADKREFERKIKALNLSESQVRKLWDAPARILRAKATQLYSQRVDNPRGKLPASWKRAPIKGGLRVGFTSRHAHIVESGTAQRQTRKGYNRGSSPARLIMHSAFSESSTEMFNALNKGLQATLLR